MTTDDDRRAASSILALHRAGTLHHEYAVTRMLKLIAAAERRGME